MMGLIGGTQRGIFGKKSHSSVGLYNIKDNGMWETRLSNKRNICFLSPLISRLKKAPHTQNNRKLHYLTGDIKRNKLKLSSIFALKTKQNKSMYSLFLI